MKYQDNRDLLVAADARILPMKAAKKTLKAAKKKQRKAGNPSRSVRRSRDEFLETDPDSRERVSQSGRALGTLREMLLGGEFRPGERISEVPIAARLGVSRTPVRLALERLALEGLLQTTSAGGFTVRTFTIVEIWDAIEVRAVLEGAAARLAAERLTHPKELDILKSYCEELEGLAQRHSTTTTPTFDFLLQYSDLNKRFHEALIDASRSSMLKWNLARLRSVPFAGPGATIIPEGLTMFLQVALKQHRSILEAIEAKEGDKAETLAREHAKLARRHLEIALQRSLPGASLIKMDFEPRATENEPSVALWRGRQ